MSYSISGNLLLINHDLCENKPRKHKEFNCNNEKIIIKGISTLFKTICELPQVLTKIISDYINDNDIIFNPKFFKTDIEALYNLSTPIKTLTSSYRYIDAKHINLNIKVFKDIAITTNYNFFDEEKFVEIEDIKFNSVIIYGPNDFHRKEKINGLKMMVGISRSENPYLYTDKRFFFCYDYPIFNNIVCKKSFLYKDENYELEIKTGVRLFLSFDIIHKNVVRLSLYDKLQKYCLRFKELGYKRIGVLSDEKVLDVISNCISIPVMIKIKDGNMNIYHGSFFSLLQEFTPMKEYKNITFLDIISRDNLGPNDFDPFTFLNKDDKIHRLGDVAFIATTNLTIGKIYTNQSFTIICTSAFIWELN